MAIWKISIKYTTKIMGCGQLEKGMFVEYEKNDSFFDPIHGRLYRAQPKMSRKGACK